MKSKFLFIAIIILFLTRIDAQTQANLEVINGLIEKSISKADSLVGGKQKIFLSVSTPPALEVLKPKIIQSFSNKDYEIQSSQNDLIRSVDYTLTSVKVEYKNSFTDGFFGKVYFEREIFIRYALLIKNLDQIVSPYEFMSSRKDTVANDQIENLETLTLPFTHADRPQQSALSGIWEPIVVVGTLIVTIILLFTVRSK